MDEHYVVHRLRAVAAEYGPSFGGKKNIVLPPATPSRTRLYSVSLETGWRQWRRDAPITTPQFAPSVIIIIIYIYIHTNTLYIH